MRTKYTSKERFQYWFDNTLSAGTISIIIWLAIVSLLIVIFSGIVITVFGLKVSPDDEAMPFFEAVWQSFMRTIDSGAVAGDVSWPFRMWAFIVTVGGIFIVSTLIGTLTSGLEGRLEEIRKGKSKVLESNHTLILGWSPKVFNIIEQLIIANESSKKTAIVILSSQSKVDMEDEINQRITNRKHTKIICRSGNMLDRTDLEIVNPDLAKSIIVLSGSDENADIDTLKTILAITNKKNRRKQPYHLVAEIKYADSLEATQVIAKDEATYIYAPELIAKLVTQTCRQSGLSIVYTELLNFEGDEIYIKQIPALIGKTYAEVLLSFNKSLVIGIVQNGKTLINPESKTVINSGDMIILIAEDDTKIAVNTVAVNPVLDENAPVFIPHKLTTETNALLGWNIKAPAIIWELEKYVAPGSKLTIIVDNAFVTADEINAICNGLKNQQLTLIFGDISKSNVLVNNGLQTYDNIIILGYPYQDIQKADAITLLCLIHLRNIAKNASNSFSILSEMFDERNRELAEVAKADDFIISDNFISMIITQISEDNKLKTVFDTLFSAEGSEIYLKPLTNYFPAAIELDFYQICNRVSAFNDTAIGYRIYEQRNQQAQNYGIVINPDKSAKIKLSEHDKIIVLSENY